MRTVWGGRLFGCYLHFYLQRLCGWFILRPALGGVAAGVMRARDVDVAHGAVHGREKVGRGAMRVCATAHARGNADVSTTRACVSERRNRLRGETTRSAEGGFDPPNQPAAGRQAAGRESWVAVKQPGHWTLESDPPCWPPRCQPQSHELRHRRRQAVGRAVAPGKSVTR